MKYLLVICLLISPAAIADDDDNESCSVLQDIDAVCLVSYDNMGRTIFNCQHYNGTWYRLIHGGSA